MKRKKGTTKKKYDVYITPQNEPQIKLKRLVHFLCCFWFAINCIVLARLLPDSQKMRFILLAFVLIVCAFIQQMDNRRDNWAWWGLIFFAIFSVVILVMDILAYGLYWCLIVIAVQILISTIIFIIFKKSQYF